MKKVLVTGSNGFIGKNLCVVLKQHNDIEVFGYDINDNPEELDKSLKKADYIIHLAGVNRTKKSEEFDTGNTESIDAICRKLLAIGRAPKIILASSIQADLDNPYGISKLRAEGVLRRFSEDSGAECVVFRFKNLFGKWGRPNYNSVTATFCHNIAKRLPIQISDPANLIELTHIDDVNDALKAELTPGKAGYRVAVALPSTSISLGVLAEKIRAFQKMRSSLVLPDFSDKFDRALYGTYLSYLDKQDFGYSLEIKTDLRGSLAEFLKSPAMGQIFVSRTKPGITRGDHCHHTKTEKFLVLQGTAIIRFRHIGGSPVIEYQVRGEDYHVVDIPPGYTHSIENVGQDELVTLFWASEPFDPQHPDTFFEKVMKG